MDHGRLRKACTYVSHQARQGERKRFSLSSFLNRTRQDESCAISLLPTCAAGPCKHCRTSFKGGLRDDWKPAEAPGRVRKDVAEQVEEPVLRSLENGQLVLLPGETEPPKIGLTLSLPASGWSAVGHLFSFRRRTSSTRTPLCYL